MVASAENVLKSTENNSKSCEKPLNGRRETVFLHIYFLTSSLKKYVFHNWLINNILYLCVT